MATSKVLNGHPNGDLLNNLNKKFNDTTSVETENEFQEKTYTNGIDKTNGDSDYIDEEERKYLEEVERIRKLTR